MFLLLGAETSRCSGLIYVGAITASSSMGSCSRRQTIRPYGSLPGSEWWAALFVVRSRSLSLHRLRRFPRSPGAVRWAATRSTGAERLRRLCVPVRGRIGCASRPWSRVVLGSGTKMTERRALCARSEPSALSNLFGEPRLSRIKWPFRSARSSRLGGAVFIGRPAYSCDATPW